MVSLVNYNKSYLHFHRSENTFIVSITFTSTLWRTSLSIAISWSSITLPSTLQVPQSKVGVALLKLSIWKYRGWWRKYRGLWRWSSSSLTTLAALLKCCHLSSMHINKFRKSISICIISIAQHYVVLL